MRFGRRWDLLRVAVVAGESANEFGGQERPRPNEGERAKMEAHGVVEDAT